MITLHPLSRDDIGKVAHLVLPDAQANFVGPIEEMTSDPDPHVRLHYAQKGGTVVGFFKTDLDFSRTIAHLPAKSMGMRGLLIGGQYQGQGFGKMLLQAVPGYLRNTYPAASKIWLSVDAENRHAIRCYETAGWVKTGPQRDGRCGKEDIMRLDLTKTEP